MVLRGHVVINSQWGWAAQAAGLDPALCVLTIAASDLSSSSGSQEDLLAQRSASRACRRWACTRGTQRGVLACRVCQVARTALRSPQVTQACLSEVSGRTDGCWGCSASTCLLLTHPVPAAETAVRRSARQPRAGAQARQPPVLEEGARLVVLLQLLPQAPQPLSPAPRVQENSGNNPSTQLVPSASSKGSWQKPEEPAQPVDARAPALTAGSNWAASGGRGPQGSAGQNWQPPEGPYLTGAAYGPRDRQLNPHEYPSLAAAANPRPNFAKQPTPSVAHGSHQVRLLSELEQWCV